MLGMSRVIVPACPGVFSAVGLLLADVEHHVIKGYVAPFSSLNPSELSSVLDELEEGVKAELRDAGLSGDLKLSRMAVIKLGDRSGEVVVELPGGRLTATDLVPILDRFHDSYRQIYQHVPTDANPVLVRLWLVARMQRGVDPDAIFRSLTPVPGPGAGARRNAHFGPEFGSLVTPVVSRDSLIGVWHEGPIIVEEADSSTVVRPGWRATCDGNGNLIIER
jgi:N-methylhydantoinase A